MDVEYALIGFASGEILMVIVEGIQVIAGGFAGVGEMLGMFLYPEFYNIYQLVYNQLPANETYLQAAVNHSFQNYINYVSQAQNYSISVNTLLITLQITIFTIVFIIVLEILMRLGMPRNEDAPAGY